MKAFLMFKGRDFDPHQLLARRDNELRHRRGKEQGLELQQILPWNEAALRQDLGLDIIFHAMAQGDRFLLDAVQVGMLSSLTDLETIQYRQEAYRDCASSARIVRAMYQIAIDAIEGERKNYWMSARYPSGILHRAVEVLQVFVPALKRLRYIADQDKDKFKSAAFSNLIAMLRKELSDDYFAEVENHLKRLKFRAGVLVSAHLGKGNKGANYVLRAPQGDNRNWLTRLLGERRESYTFRLHPRDEAGAQALGRLKDQGVNLVADAVAQSTDHILSFFHMLRAELAFYIGCLNLHAKLAELGEPVCLPAPASTGERTLSFANLYDAALALSSGRSVVGNELKADGKDLIIVTGANTGGKSTFLRSLGLAHVMMQAGMFVPAEQFLGEAASGFFSHFKREEDAAMESGKWDEELSRMSTIVDHLQKNATVLFNESFASTNEREGSEIAAQIVNALLERGVRVFFVTHLYEFAHRFVARKQCDVAFLRAERNPDGTRPFKLVEAEPLETSYGPDLYDAIFNAGAATQHLGADRDKTSAGRLSDRESRRDPARQPFDPTPSEG
jgi:DNA mismatch repair ATPase MutS